MLESMNNGTLEYKKLSPEEMQRRGILGRLVGIVADFLAPTRNGRHYSEELWEKVFEDPIMKERIENGVCFGELCHPTDREETEMEKVAVCMPEVPKKNSDGKLTAVFDILNTPNGKILKTLCDYGSTLGVSSRGSGDTYTGSDGNEEVEPDSYTCQGFDIVLIPAVESARLKYVTESLNNKKSLRESLQDTIDNASDEDKKVMEETIKNLDLDESKEEKEILYVIKDKHGNQLSKPIADDNELWDRVEDKDPYGKKGLRVVAYTESLEENPSTDLNIDEEPKTDSVGNSEEMLEALQVSLKQNKELEQKIITLNEKLSVCYAKESKYEEQLETYKNRVSALSKNSNRITALKTRVDKLNEELATKDSSIEKLNKKIDRLNEGIKKQKSSTKSLNEELGDKDSNIQELNNTINELNEKLNTQTNAFKKQTNSLNETIANLQKDLQQNKVSYSNKLEKSNKLVEKYKKITTNVVNKYIESQAMKLGVSANEIKNKLPESYSISDIDKICEDMREYKLNISKLPFKTMTNLNENMTLKAKPSTNELLHPMNEDDEVDDQLLSFLQK